MNFLRIRPSVGLIVWALPALAAVAPLTEGHSLQLGLNQSAFVGLLDARVDAAQGRLLARETWVNPVIELSRAELDEETETSLWLRQELDFSGQRGLNRDAARTGLAIAEAHNQAQRIQRSAEISRHFYQLLFQHQKQQFFEHWSQKFSSVEAAMKKREAAGDVSGYDRRRISREKVAIRSLQRQSEAQQAADWQQLRGMTGLNSSQEFNTVEGQLIPEALAALTAGQGKIVQPPALLQQQRQAEAFRLTARAVARSHIPPVTLGLGIKRIDAPQGSDSGLMLSASVPLPFFDRKQGARQQAMAKATRAEGEYQLARQVSDATVRGLWQKAGLLRANAKRFSEQSVAASYELVGIAEASYRANEIGVLELIDAYRSALEAETTALELALEARLIRIELDEKTAGVYQ